MQEQWVGLVSAIWRYPIKSMQGEAVSSATLTERGILGDRAYALLDCASGHIASAKHPRKWHALLACHAAYAAPPQLDAPLPPIRITLPDGMVLSSQDPDVDELLSHALEREVRLTATTSGTLMREANRAAPDAAAESIQTEELALAAPVGTFFDYAPLHLLTTAALQRLQAEYPSGKFSIQRFRPNIVVRPGRIEQDFVENGWHGRHIGLGMDVQLGIIDPTPRCVVTTLAQDQLPHDPGILRTIAQHNAAASVTLAPGLVLPAVVGVYAHVLRGGTLRLSDEIWLQSSCLLPANQERSI